MIRDNRNLSASLVTQGLQDGCLRLEVVEKDSMYTLLYGLYKYIVQKDEFCVLILGLDNAGKTVSSRSLLPVLYI
jgi:hypothetical protein